MICIFLPNFRGGGAERVSLDLAKAFKDLGQEVEFVLIKAEGTFLAEALETFSVINLDSQKTRYATLPLSAYLRHRQPDALIANMWPLTTVAVMSCILSRSQTRLLVIEHTVLSRCYSKWGWFHNLMMRLSLFVTCRMAHHVAAVSEGAARDLASMARLVADRVAVLHNPIPKRPKPSSQSIASAEHFWSCPPGRRLLSVGNIKAAKNYPLLLSAFAAQSNPDARLMILGSGDETKLKRLASDLCVADRVIFAGFCNDPCPFYATADLFVLSSDYEGFGNVIVEALSFGLPVVSTNCRCGPAEILENGRWGRLVTVGDADAMARAIEAALSTPTDHEALIRRAADFAPEIAARKYLELLGLS